MGNRCPDCNKFVGLVEEVTSVDLDVNDGDHVSEAVVTVEIVVSRCCAECGTELMEAVFSTDVDVDVSSLCRDDLDGQYDEEPELEPTKRGIRVRFRGELYAGSGIGNENNPNGSRTVEFAVDEIIPHSDFSEA